MFVEGRMTIGVMCRDPVLGKDAPGVDPRVAHLADIAVVLKEKPAAAPLYI
jgi:hypothetical protein